MPIFAANAASNVASPSATVDRVSDDPATPLLNNAVDSTRTVRAQAKAQRASIKQIARELDKALNRFERQPNHSFRFTGELETIQASLIDARQRLRSYNFRQLDATPRNVSFLRKARSRAAVLAGAMARTGAAGVSGTMVLGYSAVHGSLNAVASLPTGLFMGMVKGLVGRAARHNAPPAPTGTFAKEVGTGFFQGIVAPFVPIYRNVTQRGSINKQTFRALDWFPASRAYAARMNMTTRQIATSTDLKLDETLARIEEKRTLFPKFKNTIMPLS